MVGWLGGWGGRPDSPEGRLVFLSTNHVAELPHELITMVDKNGMRVEFPCASLEMMAEMVRPARLLVHTGRTALHSKSALLWRTCMGVKPA